MLRYGDHILTVQAHPEFGLDYMRQLLPDITPRYITVEDAERGLSILSSQEARPARMIDAIVEVLNADY